MNKALICIGTNNDREVNLAMCHDLLAAYFPQIMYSDTSVTTPYGLHYTSNFLNQLVLVSTTMDAATLCLLLKKIEQQMGRAPSDKEKGIVKIDVDLIRWNDEIIRPAEMERDYIKKLLPTFNL